MTAARTGGPDALPEETPILVGVGEVSERVGAPGYGALSPADLAGEAARRAFADAGLGGDAVSRLDLLAAIRQFEISGSQAVAPFGRADNPPRAVARRLGADPARAVLEVVGGQGPQKLVNEIAHLIAAGRSRMALICGAEAISTVRHLLAQGETRDWSETAPGELEDRGYGLEGLLSRELAAAGARTPMLLYGLFENARRARLGSSRDAYRLGMGRLFAPLTDVAAENPHAMAPERFTAEELAAVTPRNRLVADPYTRRLVARDQANQGAAVLMTSVGHARALGVSPDRWVFLHGGADVKAREPLARDDLAAYPAAAAAGRAALGHAGVGADEIELYDLYSCFPIAVTSVAEPLGIEIGPGRAPTVTGGLPFFGGAGNNYSMHAVAEMVRRLRERPDAFGFVGANGGFLSKYSVGIYSARPRPFRPFDSEAAQAEADRAPVPERAPEDACEGVVETYTIDFSGEAPRGVLILRTDAGARFPAATAPGEAVSARMVEAEPLGARVRCRIDEAGRRVAVGLDPA